MILDGDLRRDTGMAKTFEQMIGELQIAQTNTNRWEPHQQQTLANLEHLTGMVRGLLAKDGQHDPASYLNQGF